MNAKDKLKKDFINIGLKENDIVMIRADISNILKNIPDLKAKDILSILLEVVGENGTIVAPAYTSSSFIRRDKKIIFTKKSRTTSGLFSMVMLANTKSIRSEHPTNSHVAIGKYAEYILENHNENAGAYEPTRRIMELGGKMLMFGCIKTSFGFNTTHLAEFDLGLHKRLILPTLVTSYYEKNGEIKLFKRKDLGMCASNWYKLFGLYVRNEVLIQGYIGGSYSLIANAQDAYDIDYKVLSDNPKFNICKNKDCMQCRAQRWDNLIDLPFFIIRKILKKLGKIIKKIKG